MLRQRAVTAIGWSAMDQVLQQGLFFAVSVTLARLVAPEAFGTIGLLSLFTGIASVFIEGGLGAALVQRKETSRVDESTVFWYNLTVASFLGLCLFLAAPAIAAFYRAPNLAAIARCYALQLVLSACNSVQTTLFSKRLDFKTPMQCKFAAGLLAGIVGIAMAWRGHGVWALVAQSLVSTIAVTALTWAASDWRPALCFSAGSFRSLYRFGGFLFLSALLNAIYMQLYSLLIGRWCGVHDLGIYNRAQNTKQLPAGVLTGILSRVAFPLFSEANDNPERLRRGLCLAIRSVMFVNIPAMLGLAAVADPLIFTLFGPAWKESIPLLQILAIGGVCWPLHVLNLTVLQALGHSAAFLKLEVVKFLLGGTMLLLGCRFGTHGMALAVTSNSLLLFCVNACYTERLVRYGPWRQVRDVAPALTAGAAMAFAVGLLNRLLPLSPCLKLPALVGFGGLAYVFLSKLLRIAELDEARRIVRSKIVLRIRQFLARPLSRNAPPGAE